MGKFIILVTVALLATGFYFKDSINQGVLGFDSGGPKSVMGGTSSFGGAMNNTFKGFGNVFGGKN